MGKAGGFSMDFKGDKALTKMLKELGPRVQKNVARRAVRAGCRPIIAAAKAKAPRESGLLARAMGATVSLQKKTGDVNGRIAPRHGDKWSGEHDGQTRVPAKYAHLVEHGHVAADGSVVEGQPFLTPAMDEQQGAALSKVRKTLSEGIVKETKKMRGKQ